MHRISAFVLAAWTLLLANGRAQDAWPLFRNGAAAGVVEQGLLPDSWSLTKNIIWKTDIPGRGWSSPIIWGDRVFVTSVVRDGAYEEAKKGLYFGGDRRKPEPLVQRWMVYAIDWNTGKILWQRQAHEGMPDTPIHIKNSYASETPATDGERLYAYFGNVGLFCYDLAGKLLWTQKWGSFPTANGWGLAASPVLHQDRIYIVNDNEKESFLVALDKRSGKQVWKVARDEHSNWATPFIWENELRTEIVTCGRNKVRSYDLDGKLLWELAGMSQIVIPTPVSKFGMLYITSGYVLDRARPIYAIRAGASGDISLKEKQTENGYIIWHQRVGGPYNPSPIIYGEYLYVLYDRGFLSCYDARTGKEIYSQQRLGRGANAFTASPWANDGKIFCLSEDGDTFVVRAGPKFEVLGKNSLDEMCMATPAASRGSLIVRTESKLYRIGAKASAATR